MTMLSPVIFTPLSSAMPVTGSQPNEFDLRRLKRMLEKRERYRYVTVSIAPTTRGYHITSPCCSRSIASDGHLIDIAMIEYEDASSSWKLFGKNHTDNTWSLHHRSDSLRPLVEYLIADPSKTFWQ